MARKAALTALCFLVAGALVVAAGMAAEPSTGVRPIEASSPCPVTQCASGECHGYENVPVPDGRIEMICPEAGCASNECHAWETLADRYHQASDASLNVWILGPACIVAVVVLIARRDAL